MAKAEGDGNTGRGREESISIADVRDLSRRMLNRGFSLVFSDQPYLQADMKLSGRVLLAFCEGKEVTDNVTIKPL